MITIDGRGALVAAYQNRNRILASDGNEKERRRRMKHVIATVCVAVLLGPVRAKRQKK